MLVSNIDEVLTHLETTIDDSRTSSNRLGFFPAVYRQITYRVKQGIETDLFDNGSRMDSFATQFANRYFQALESYQNGRNLSRSWKVAFETANESNVLILQHILLGMNAHINFDLAVVTAEIGASSSLPDIEADYNKINDILESVLDEIQERINQLSPLFDILDRIGGSKDEAVANFSIKKARQKAWEKATVLAGLPSSLWPPTINLLDTEVAFLARLVANPGGILGKAIEVVQWTEEDDISKIIDILS